MANVVANRYAAAIFELGLENDSLKAYYDSLVLLKGAFHDNPELMDVLKHPKIHSTDKKRIVKNVFENNIDPKIVCLIELLIDKGRTFYLKEIIESFIDIYKEHIGLIDVTVVSATKLENDQEDKLKNLFSKRFKKDVSFKFKVDPSILGGIILMADGKIIDGSIRNELRNMNRFINDISL